MEQFTANKKPLFDSDIDPKRIKSVADGLRRQGEFESARMLDGYADLLEAREKAVPFGYAYRYWDGIRFDTGGREINGSKPTATIPLYTHTPTHPAPSDAERLAEALRNLVSEWVAIADDGDATLEDSTIGYRACANRLSAMLAARSAQAQPPAASVTDAMVKAAMRADFCGHNVADALMCGTDWNTEVMRAALEAALAAQEHHNG